MIVLTELNPFGISFAPTTLNKRCNKSPLIPAFKEKTTIVSKNAWL
jgi:hypothetical protein